MKFNMEHSVVVNGDLLELSLSGKFTFSDNKAFNNFLDEIGKNSYKKVIIDLNGVEFIDSAALGILLLTRDRCERNKTKLLVKNPKGQVRRMFDISRFSDLFQVEHD